MVRSKTEAEIKRILLQDGVPPADNMYYDIVLAACPDFVLEKSALQAMVEARGHYLHLLHALPVNGRGHGVRLGLFKKIIQAKTREEGIHWRPKISSLQSLKTWPRNFCI